MAFRNALMSNKTTTENGAVSFKTTKSNALDFFFKVVRNTPSTTTERMFADSFGDSKNMSMRLAFHLRDCRGGKGEREQFRSCLKWLAENDLNILLINIKHVPFYGRWDDLLCLLNTPAETVMLSYYARALINDKKIMDTSLETPKTDAKTPKISLAAKWAPTEGASLDRKTGVAYKLGRLIWNLVDSSNTISETDAKKVVPKTLKAVMTMYRKAFIAPLRKRLSLIETQMSQNLWDEIPYAQVPSLCMFKHRKAFAKHSEARFQQYLVDVKAGKTKINAGQVFPHQLVAHYMSGGALDETIELQWAAIVKDLKSKVSSGTSSLGNCISIVDVSGSMGGTPMEVAIALGLLVAEVAPKPFRGLTITFSENPQFHQIKGSTLRDRVHNLKRADWGMTTNYHKVFDLILTRCKKHNVSSQDMPKRMFVFSDMQFNSSNRDGISEHSKMVQKFRANGFNPPEIVFWNLRGDTVDFPETVDGVKYTDAGVAMVSGFSPALLQLFTDSGSLDPIGIMKKALYNPRYYQIETDPGALTDETVYRFV